MELGLCLGLDSRLVEGWATRGSALGSGSGFGSGFGSMSGSALRVAFSSSCGSASASESGTRILHKNTEVALLTPPPSSPTGALSTTTPRGTHLLAGEGLCTLPRAPRGPSGRSWGLQQPWQEPWGGTRWHRPRSPWPVTSRASGAERAPRRGWGQGGG